ncbi:DUF917 domain-containing protein [Pimelobacter simplex]|uniref:DUF917 domain-containing protein n=1 Tax=Nocardioides simplex TaxID=2045 RepID=UPI003AAC8741
MHELTSADIGDLALGATLLGAGGGGDVRVASLMLQHTIEQRGPVRIVRAEDLDPEAYVLPVANMGAPTVFAEKLPTSTEYVAAVTELAHFLRVEPAAVMPLEVGGHNTLLPFVVAAELGLPVVDADGMRRALPQLEMTTFGLHGIPAAPLSVADEHGNAIIIRSADNELTERLARGTIMLMGISNAISCYAMTARQVGAAAIQGSIAYCCELGRRWRAVMESQEDAWARFAEYSGAQLLFAGKVVDIDWRTTDRFARGTVVIEHLVEPDRTMRVEVQNELLIAIEDGRPLLTPPDLLCAVDHDHATPVATHDLAYGERIDLFALPAAPEWRRAGYLDLVGPRAFGYDVPYVPR